MLAGLPHTDHAIGFRESPEDGAGWSITYLGRPPEQSRVSNFLCEERIRNVAVAPDTLSEAAYVAGNR